MRGILFALAFAISVSLTAMAQQTLAIAPEAQSSRALSAASYLDRGNGWLNKGEFERAIADYSLSIVFDAGNAGAYYNRGMARAGKGDVDGALANLDQAIKLAPGRGHLLIHPRHASLLQGHARRALGDLSPAIQLAADD